MNTKKILAAGLAATMVLGSTVAVFADYAGQSGNASGTGQLEGYVEVGDIVSVEVSTIPAVGFTIDPQGLLTEATGANGDNSNKFQDGEGAVYFTNVTYYADQDSVTVVEGDNSTDDGKGGTIASGTFYVQAADGKYYETGASSAGSYSLAAGTTQDDAIIGQVAKTITYSNTSDALTATNKSSFGVDVDFKVELTKNGTDALEDVALVSEDDLATATEASLYVGVVKDSDPSGTAISEDVSSVSKELTATPVVADAVKYAVGDIVTVVEGDDSTSDGNSGTIASGSFYVLASDGKYYVTDATEASDSYVLTDGTNDSNIVGTVDRIAAVTDGYKLVASDTDSSGRGLTASPNGYYYWYALTPAYVAAAEQEVSFKLTAACNNVDGWSSVDTSAVSAKVTYTLKKHADYTDGGVAYGNWNNSALWLAKNSSTGFDAATLTTEISVNGGAYTAIDSTVNTSNNWVSITWTNISAKTSGANTGFKIRVTDTTNNIQYVCEM